MFGGIHLWSCLVLDFYFLETFKITASISLLVIGLLRFSISLWFSLTSLCVSMNLSISSRFSNLLVYIVLVVSKKTIPFSHLVVLPKTPSKMYFLYFVFFSDFCHSSSNLFSSHFISEVFVCLMLFYLLSLKKNSLGLKYWVIVFICFFLYFIFYYNNWNRTQL